MLEHPEKDAPELSAFYFCLKKRKCDHLLKRDHVIYIKKQSNKSITYCVTMNARIQVIFSSITSVCLRLDTNQLVSSPRMRSLQV